MLQANLQTRPFQLFHRRLLVAQTFPPLHRHVAILQRLGVEGMSDDESDVEEMQTRQRPPRYFVIQPAWRAKALTSWLQIFDSVHILLRRTDGEPSQGAFPRQRIYNYRPQRFSRAKKYVSHLPLNTYDKRWLSTIHNIDFSVCPQKTPYDFVHDQEAMS
jgi:hypothetical protein